MSSAVDICNLALSHLGDEATVSSINPPEGSAQAEKCARYYPIARDALLERYQWTFAITRAVLAPMAVSVGAWAYCYALPSDALRVLMVLAPDEGETSLGQSFDTETLPSGQRVLVTHQNEASARYVRRVTDTTRFSPLFADALSWWLAGYLAGPLLKGEAGRKAAKDLRVFALTMSGNAADADGSQSDVTAAHVPEWLAAR